MGKDWPAEGTTEWSPVLISDEDPDDWWIFGTYTAYGSRETAEAMLLSAIKDAPEGFFEKHPGMHVGLAVRAYTPWRLA